MFSRKYVNPDGEMYTFASSDNTAGVEEGGTGPIVSVRRRGLVGGGWVGGGSRDEDGSSGIRRINQYEGSKIRRIDQRRKKSENNEEKNREESKAELGFGPYADWAHGEVSTRNPRYAEFLMEEGKRDNTKMKFTQW